MSFPLASATPASLGLDERALDRLHETVTRHIAEGRYPASQFAVARHGKLAVFATLGDARLDPQRVAGASDTLWLLYSNTKVLTACAVWILVERGALAFTDRVAAHLPGFEANGKGDITLVQLLSHQGGFPNADVPPAAWEDHELLRRTVCGFTLEWTPGSRVHYHGRAAHWTAAALIEALTKTDYRAFIRENIVEPLGLGSEIFVGVPDAAHGPLRGHARAEPRRLPPDPARRGQHRRLSARGHAGGRGLRHGPGHGRLLSDDARGRTSERGPATVAADGGIRHAKRHRRSSGRLHGNAHAPGSRPAPARDARTPSAVSEPSPRRARSVTGASGSSYCWADPASGVSFAYLTNSRVPDPWHSARMDTISNLVHAAID